jgi:hypothetical protein
MPRPSRFTPGEDPVTAGLEGAENLAQTGSKSPDLPVRSEPLYRLSYPGPLPSNVAVIFVFDCNQNETWAEYCSEAV